ncbi:MAG: NADPH:quinone reductase [Oceanospirillaceae bacterium]|nr:NADPH:quinone reductase [Oceanospirillaceae bacterium]
MPRILIIVGHPDSHSLCSTLARAYQAGAVQAGHPCELIQLGELSFDPVLHHGYKEIQPLEPCLQTLQDKIQQADHLVFAYPLWWGAMPALLKGFFDRVFLPGFAFRYRDHSVLWDKLLSGKSARVLVTMDTPKWYYRFIYRQPGHQQIRRTILGFCGVRPVRISSFAIVKTSTNKKTPAMVRLLPQAG